jgi:hypothetical protein
MSDLSPRDAEIVRAFAAALRQARLEETERLRDVVSRLELFHAGMSKLCAEVEAATAQLRD